jgi:quercetin dioxygenase-like cupin family protein
MTPDVRELLPLYVLGLLEPEQVTVVEQAVRRDPALAAELASYDAAAARLIEGVAPVAPPPAIRDRLLASIGGGRFERFVQRMTEIYDVAVDRARELLGLIEDPKTYEEAFPGFAGVNLIHFAGGQAAAGADCGFILMPPGGEFPWHRHDGEELVLVLQGEMIDVDGTVYRPGEEDHKPPASEHSFTAGTAEPLIFAARVWGVRFDVEKPK